MSTVDVLIRKSDKAVLRHWPGQEARVFEGGAESGTVRPLDLGDRILVAAAEDKPAPGENEKLIGPTFVVGNGPNFATTATWAVEALPPPPSNQDLADALAFQAKVFQAFVLVMVDELNLVRAAASLSARTVQQAKNAIKAKMDILP